jgi:hypothetical protein
MPNNKIWINDNELSNLFNSLVNNISHELKIKIQFINSITNEDGFREYLQLGIKDYFKNYNIYDFKYTENLMKWFICKSLSSHIIKNKINSRKPLLPKLSIILIKCRKYLVPKINSGTIKIGSPTHKLYLNIIKILIKENSLYYAINTNMSPIKSGNMSKKEICNVIKNKTDNLRKKFCSFCKTNNIDYKDPRSLFRYYKYFRNDLSYF